jgi:hypothetical protein
VKYHLLEKEPTIPNGLKDASYLGELHAALANACHQLGDASNAINHWCSSIEQERMALAQWFQESHSQLDQSHYRRLLKRLKAVCQVYVDFRQYSHAQCVFKEIDDIHLEVTGPNSQYGSHALPVTTVYTIFALLPRLRISLTLLQYSNDAEHSSNDTVDAGTSHFPPMSPLALGRCVGDSLNAMISSDTTNLRVLSVALWWSERIPYQQDVTIIYYNLAMKLSLPFKIVSRRPQD